ncbi:MAG TPA: hypothetical protein PLN06_11395, partial [Bacteroidales bacterium]|nr:hypothetical protein [Bacteroidales bacterium]HPL18457.1 hypothetical protein [Spirochaetota bacterium]
MKRVLPNSTTTESLWEERMRRFEQSRLTAKAFCQKEHIPLSTFTWWRRRLKGETHKPGTTCFDEVLRKGTFQAGRAAIFLIINGISYEIPEVIIHLQTVCVNKVDAFFYAALLDG